MAGRPRQTQFIWLPLIAALCGIDLSGCGVIVRQYVYPPTHGVDETLLVPLTETLSDEGVVPQVALDSVDYDHDPLTKVRFLIRPSFSLAIITDRRKYPSKQVLDQHFRAVRERAEGYLGKARARQAAQR